jgi:solute carrier family 34 (sodium-dependent phosphate cotransporter)
MRPGEGWLRGVAVLTLLFLFLVGIRTMGTGFEGLGKDLLESFFEATDNPVIGLVVGILATTLMQSSSVTTSMIVALVAAPENPLPIANAIPMIMGANVGTTVTSTIVALGHMGHRDDLRRAFAAATCHDFFNLLSVVTLLPLEAATGVLGKASLALARVFEGSSGARMPNPLKEATKAVAVPIEEFFIHLPKSPKVGATILIVVSVALIFVTLALIVKLLRRLTASRMGTIMTRSLDSTPVLGILIGAVATVMVQSSSITTSILVPLAGAGLVTTAQIFPVVIGCNLGTTVTALLASMGTAAETAMFGRQIALVHLLFNLAGLLLIYPLPITRRIPVVLADRFATMAAQNRKLAVLLILGAFYGVPALLIAAVRMF